MCRMAQLLWCAPSHRLPPFPLDLPPFTFPLPPTVYLPPAGQLQEMGFEDSSAACDWEWDLTGPLLPQAGLGAGKSSSKGKGGTCRDARNAPCCCTMGVCARAVPACEAVAMTLAHVCACTHVHTSTCTHTDTHPHPHTHLQTLRTAQPFCVQEATCGRRRWRPPRGMPWAWRGSSWHHGPCLRVATPATACTPNQVLVRGCWVGARIFHTCARQECVGMRVRSLCVSGSWCTEAFWGMRARKRGRALACRPILASQEDCRHGPSVLSCAQPRGLACTELRHAPRAPACDALSCQSPARQHMMHASVFAARQHVMQFSMFCVPALASLPLST